MSDAPDPAAVATRLLDAQVEFVLAELTGERLAAVIARDVDAILGIAERRTVADVLDADAAKQVLRRIVDKAGAGPLVEQLIVALSDALYALDASDDHKLGEVVDRKPVEALVVKLLAMHDLQERALDRLAESPLVATVAQRFVSKIVSDFIAQNRQLAERLPGAKSLFSLGSSAASRVRNVSIVGAAADKGTQMAMRQTNSALRDVMRGAPLRGAAMELWDLQAGEPVSALREYLSQQDLRELALLVHEILRRAGGSEYVGVALDACVDVFVESYGTRTVSDVLAELGIQRDEIVADLSAALPPLVDAARRDGELAALVRKRLEPFFTSGHVRAILAGDEPPAPRKGKPRPKAAKKAAG